MRAVFLSVILALGMGAGAAWGEHHEHNNKQAIKAGKAIWQSNPEAWQIIRYINTSADIKSKQARRYLFLHPQWVKNPRILWVLDNFSKGQSLVMGELIDGQRRAKHLSKNDARHLKTFFKVAGKECIAAQIGLYESYFQLEQYLHSGKTSPFNSMLVLNTMYVTRLLTLWEMVPNYECTQPLARILLDRGYIKSDISKKVIEMIVEGRDIYEIKKEFRKRMDEGLKG